MSHVFRKENLRWTYRVGLNDPQTWQEEEKSHCHMAGIALPPKATGTETDRGSTKEQTQDTVNTPLSKSQGSRILKNNKKPNTESQNSGSQNPKAYYHLLSFERILS